MNTWKEVIVQQRHYDDLRREAEIYRQNHSRQFGDDRRTPADRRLRSWATWAVRSHSRQEWRTIIVLGVVILGFALALHLAMLGVHSSQSSAGIRDGMSLLLVR